MHNIVIDCERMKYEHTGLYHYCKQLSNSIIQQSHPAQETIRLYAPATCNGQFPGKTVFIFPKAWHKFIFPNTSGIDLWHCTYQGSNYFPYKSKAKKVLTIHDLNFLEEKKGRSEKINTLLKKLQQKIDYADHLIAISSFTADIVKSNLKTGSKEISVIYNGCNIQEMTLCSEPLTKPAGEFIFTIGTITGKKNFHVLPALLKGNDLQLVIAGIESDPLYKQKIWATATALGVEKRVLFTGPVSEHDKQWYYKNCKAFVFPSLTEGFGLPVIEAMHFGKPVILSRLTALPEIGGEVAYYFDSFEPEAMQQVFEKTMHHFEQHPERANELKARSMIFSWQEAGKKHLEIYHRLLA